MVNPSSCILNDIFGFIGPMATAVFCSRIRVWEVILYWRSLGELTLLGKLENQLSSVQLILSLSRVQNFCQGLTWQHVKHWGSYALWITLPIYRRSHCALHLIWRPSLMVKASVCDIWYEAFPLNILNVTSSRSLKILRNIIYYVFPTELNKLCLF